MDILLVFKGSNSNVAIISDIFLYRRLFTRVRFFSGTIQTVHISSYLHHTQYIGIRNINNHDRLHILHHIPPYRAIYILLPSAEQAWTVQDYQFVFNRVPWSTVWCKSDPVERRCFRISFREAGVVALIGLKC